MWHDKIITNPPSGLMFHLNCLVFPARCVYTCRRLSASERRVRKHTVERQRAKPFFWNYKPNILWLFHPFSRVKKKRLKRCKHSKIDLVTSSPAACLSPPFLTPALFPSSLCGCSSLTPTGCLSHAGYWPGIHLRKPQPSSVWIQTHEAHRLFTAVGICF